VLQAWRTVLEQTHATNRTPAEPDLRTLA
jgi:hypothetical protein